MRKFFLIIAIVFVVLMKMFFAADEIGFEKEITDKGVTWHFFGVYTGVNILIFLALIFGWKYRNHLYQLIYGEEDKYTRELRKYTKDK